MGTLAVTCQGPFIFSIEKSAVKVYAPDCVNHVAAISSVDAEAEIHGQNESQGTYLFELFSGGIIPNFGAIAYPLGSRKSDYILDGPPGQYADLAKAKFCIQLPRPSMIYATNPDPTEVVKDGKPTGNSSLWATGLRLYYDYDLTQNISFRALNSTNGTTFSFSNLATFTDYADIEIQHVGPIADDPQHDDAIACFGKAMTLLGLPWTLSYSGGSTGKFQAFSRPGGDCKSPEVVLGR